MRRGLVEHRHDERLARDGEQEDAAEGCRCLVPQLQDVDHGGARILQLVAERRTAEEIDEVDDGKVVRVCDVPER